MSSSRTPLRFSAPTTSSHSYTVDVEQRTEGFDLLREEWENLLRDDPHATVFQTFEWQRTWWKHFGESNTLLSLFLLLIRDQGKMVGIAPCCIEQIRPRGVLFHRRLIFLGKRITDYLNLLILPGYEEVVVESIAEAIVDNRQRFDMIHFEEMSERTRAHVLLLDALKRRGCHAYGFINEMCPRTTLADTWEETTASFPSRHRQLIRKREHVLTSEFEAKYSLAKDPSRIQEDFRLFANLHQERWVVSGHQGVFGDPSVKAFHLEFALLAYQRGWLFLAFMSVHGEPVAANYGFFFKKESYFYLSGLRDTGNAARYSPGLILHAFSMREAIARGILFYDFLRGNEEYKYRFAGVGIPNWSVVAFMPGSGILLPHKFRSDLLLQSIGRRASHEAKYFLQVWRKDPRQTPLHLLKRCGKVVRDGLVKIRAPEKNVR